VVREGVGGGGRNDPNIICPYELKKIKKQNKQKKKQAVKPPKDTEEPSVRTSKWKKLAGQAACRMTCKYRTFWKRTASEMARWWESR
jgi:hypothetical protein